MSATYNEDDAVSTTLRERFVDGVDWPTALWIGLIHAGFLSLSVFFFTWKALLLFVVLACLTGCLGVCVGYHRYLTHGGFRTYRPVRWGLAILGALSGQGSALKWVAQHRKHHQHSDIPGQDPHTPLDGGFWSHMLWLFPHLSREARRELLQKWAPDLMKDAVLRFLDQTYIWLHLLFVAGLFALGMLWDLHTALSFLAWGICGRLVYTFHITWFVNSGTHKWGYRNYETDDNSTNLWWVGVLGWGEGWHNNHHADQRSARHGHRWWEIDVTYWVIWVMKKLHLVWEVRLPALAVKQR